MNEGYSNNLLAHFRLVCHVTAGVPNVVDGAVLSLIDLKGNTLLASSAVLVAQAGCIVTLTFANAIPVDQRRAWQSLHDPSATFAALALFQPNALLSEVADNTLVIGFPFQGVIPAAGNYTIDAVAGIIRV